MATVSPTSAAKLGLVNAKPVSTALEARDAGPIVDPSRPAPIDADGIRKLAEEALQRSPLHALQRLRVELVDAQLRILGTVSCFYHKQLAQETVRGVSGERLELVNALRVDAPPAR